MLITDAVSLHNVNVIGFFMLCKIQLRQLGGSEWKSSRQFFLLNADLKLC